MTRAHNIAAAAAIAHDGTGRIRVLHCPTMVGGHPQSLARSERVLGLDSRSIALQGSSFDYACDEVLVPYGTRFALFRAEIRRWQLLWRALRHCDIVHYNFGSTIMPRLGWTYIPSSTTERLLLALFTLYAHALNMRDLPLMKRAGKGIVVTYQGDDARQGDYCLAHFETSIAGELQGESYYTPASDRAKRASIARFARYADRIFYLNPDLGWILPSEARFVPYASVNPKEWTPPSCESRPAARRPVVLHAPSHRGAKGTEQILGAVKRLQCEGLDFDFLLVEKLTNREARHAYESADLLVDQLLAGWYGGLAVELMALGKPVIAYIRRQDMRFVPKEMRGDLPIIEATKENFHSVLREWLVAGPARRQDRGASSRDFVLKWHDPIRVAAAMKREYEQILQEHIRPPRQKRRSS